MECCISRELITEIMSEFEGKVFASEADFKFLLAGALKEKLIKNGCAAEVRCEFSPKKYKSQIENVATVKEDIPNKKKYVAKESNIHFDIMIIIDNKYYPIELKYRTGEYIDDEFLFELKHHNAHDEGCYGFWRDICRINEFMRRADNCNLGYVIYLTNDQWYYSGQKKRSGERDYSQFFFAPNTTIKSGKELEGQIGNKGCWKKLGITHDVKLPDWIDYRNSSTKNGEFKYMLVEVKRPSSNAT